MILNLPFQDHMWEGKEVAVNTRPKASALTLALSSWLPDCVATAYDDEPPFGGIDIASWLLWLACKSGTEDKLLALCLSFVVCMPRWK